MIYKIKINVFYNHDQKPNFKILYFIQFRHQDYDFQKRIGLNIMITIKCEKESTTNDWKNSDESKIIDIG